MKKILVSLAFLAVAPFVGAQESFQLSLTPEIALAPRGATVRGVALNIWGENQVNGLDLGFVNGLVGDSSGFSWSFLGSYAEDYTGVIWGGFFTQSTGDVVGWQSAAINLSQGTLRGLQTGLANISKDVTGVQLGFVNYTEHLHGVQLGLVNVVRSNPWFNAFPEKLATGFPFVNWSF